MLITFIKLDVHIFYAGAVTSWDNIAMIMIGKILHAVLTMLGTTSWNTTRMFPNRTRATSSIMPTCL